MIFYEERDYDKHPELDPFKDLRVQMKQEQEAQLKIKRQIQQK